MTQFAIDSQLRDVDGKPVRVPARCAGFLVRFWSIEGPARGPGRVVRADHGLPLLVPAEVTATAFRTAVAQAPGRYQLTAVDPDRKPLRNAPAIVIVPRAAAERAPSAATSAPSPEVPAAATPAAGLERVIERLERIADQLERIAARLGAVGEVVEVRAALAELGAGVAPAMPAELAAADPPADWRGLRAELAAVLLPPPPAAPAPSAPRPRTAAELPADWIAAIRAGDAFEPDPPGLGADTIAALTHFRIQLLAIDPVSSERLAIMLPVMSSMPPLETLPDPGEGLSVWSIARARLGDGVLRALFDTYTASVQGRAALALCGTDPDALLAMVRCVAAMACCVEIRKLRTAR